METNEFVNLAAAVVERLAPKIDPQQAVFVREDADAGAWDNALSNLAASLNKHHVPVTEPDRDDLRRLLIDLDESTENVDRLNVAESDSTERD